MSNLHLARWGIHGKSGVRSFWGAVCSLFAAFLLRVQSPSCLSKQDETSFQGMKPIEWAPKTIHTHTIMQIVRLKLQRQEYRLPIAKGVGCFCKLLTVKVDAYNCIPRWKQSWKEQIWRVTRPQKLEDFQWHRRGWWDNLPQLLVKHIVKPCKTQGLRMASCKFSLQPVHRFSFFENLQVDYLVSSALRHLPPALRVCLACS